MWIAADSWIGRGRLPSQLRALVEPVLAVAQQGRCLLRQRGPRRRIVADRYRRNARCETECRQRDQRTAKRFCVRRHTALHKRIQRAVRHLQRCFGRVYTSLQFGHVERARRDTFRRTQILRFHAARRREKLSSRSSLLQHIE